MLILYLSFALSLCSSIAAITLSLSLLSSFSVSLKVSPCALFFFFFLFSFFLSLPTCTIFYFLSSFFPFYLYFCGVFFLFWVLKFSPFFGEKMFAQNFFFFLISNVCSYLDLVKFKFIYLKSSDVKSF